MSIAEKIKAKGHENILAKHPTTFEITKDNYLTRRGDCIIGISADKGLLEFSEEFKKKLKEGRKVEIILRCEGSEEKVISYGDPHLTLEHPHDMVVRKSNFICNRTLAIKADKSANELNKELIEKLKQGKKLEIKLKI